MRLFDKILHAKSFYPESEEILRKATVVVADQATEYYYALNDKEHWHLTDFPNIAPPFENFFIETKAPSKIISKEWGTREWEEPATAEMLRVEGLSENHIQHYVQQCKENGNRDSRRPVSWGVHFRLVSKSTLQLEMGKIHPISDFELLDVKWAMQGTMYVEFKKSGMSGPFWEYLFGVRKDGSVVPLLTDATAAVGVDFPSPEHLETIKSSKLRAYNDFPSLIKAVRAEAFNHLNPLLLAITFLHCKNVELVNEAPPRKLAKRSKERGKPLCSYRVIDILPLKAVLKRDGTPEATGIKKALHLCRGHFKTYTPERPLLGKAVGTYFWGQQLRGSKDHGVIAKDYRIDTNTGSSKIDGKIGNRD